jgi:hypothetical protein
MLMRSNFMIDRQMSRLMRRILVKTRVINSGFVLYKKQIKITLIIDFLLSKKM